jgi:hypothetical protein
VFDLLAKHGLLSIGELWFLGHSRGGAIAVGLSRHFKHYYKSLNRLDYVVGVITEGAPAYYNEAGAYDFIQSGIIGIRIENAGDWVPGLLGGVYKKELRIVKVGFHHPLSGLGFFLGGLPHYPSEYKRLIGELKGEYI